MSKSSLPGVSQGIHLFVYQKNEDCNCQCCFILLGSVLPLSHGTNTHQHLICEHHSPLVKKFWMGMGTISSHALVSWLCRCVYRLHLGQYGHFCPMLGIDATTFVCNWLVNTFLSVCSLFVCWVWHMRYNKKSRKTNLSPGNRKGINRLFLGGLLFHF